MSIASISASPSSYQPQIRQTGKQIRQGFDDLTKALQAGDLSAAQSAFAALQKLQPGQTQGTNAASPVSTDFTALGKALQSGDVKAAQSALQQLQQDIKATHHGHHHHHHAASAQSASSSPSSVTGANGATNSDGDQDGSTGSRLSIAA